MPDMSNMINAMENAVRCRAAAASERRARELQQKKEEFEEKLRAAQVNRLELEKLNGQVKGAEDAVQRDSLINMMMGPGLL